MNLKKYFQNLLSLFSSGLLGQFFGLFSNIILARSLSTEGYGVFSTFMYVVSFFGVCASLGTKNIVIRQISQKLFSLPSIVISNLVLKSFSVAVFLGISIIYFKYLNLNINLFILLGVLFYFIGYVGFELVTSISSGSEIFFITSIYLVLRAFLWLLFTIGIVVVQLDTNYLVISFGITFLIIFILAAIHLKIFFNKTPIDRALKVQRPIDLLLSSFPFWVLAVMTALFQNIPTSFLLKNASAFEAGIYNASYKLLLPLYLFIGSANDVLLPRLMRLYKDNYEIFFSFVRLFMPAAITFVSVLVLLINPFASFYILLLYGQQYQNSIEVLQYHLISVILMTYFTIIGTLFIVAAKDRLLALLSMLFSLVSILTQMMGSFYGAKVMAMAFTLGLLFNFLYHIFYFKKVFPDIVEFKFPLILAALLFVEILIIKFCSNYLTPFSHLSLNLVFIVCLVTLQYPTIRAQFSLIKGMKWSQPVYK